LSTAKAVERTVLKVKEEALDQLTSELSRSLEEAVKIITESAQATSQTLRESSEQHAKKIEAARRQIVGAAELKARHLVLSEIEKAISEVFTEALNQLAQEHSEENRGAVLRKLIAEAIDITAGDSFVVEACERDLALLRRLASQISSMKKVRLEVGKEAIRCVGGVRLTSSDGSVSYDNTYEARLARAKPMLRKRLSDLFWARD